MYCPLFRATIFFFNDTATTEIYTLSLHDALPILQPSEYTGSTFSVSNLGMFDIDQFTAVNWSMRSEEHTSELQSLTNLVCRLLLEKKNKRQSHTYSTYNSTGRSIDDRRQNGSNGK